MKSSFVILLKTTTNCFSHLFTEKMKQQSRLIKINLNFAIINLIKLFSNIYCETFCFFFYNGILSMIHTIILSSDWLISIKFRKINLIKIWLEFIVMKSREKSYCIGGTKIIFSVCWNVYLPVDSWQNHYKIYYKLWIYLEIF